MVGRLSQIVVGMLAVAMLASAAPVDAELSIAAMKGDMATVRSLLEESVDVNASQGDGTTRCIGRRTGMTWTWHD